MLSDDNQCVLKKVFGLSYPQDKQQLMNTMSISTYLTIKLEPTNIASICLLKTTKHSSLQTEIMYESICK